jgi:hypothetical protein
MASYGGGNQRGAIERTAIFGCPYTSLEIAELASRTRHAESPVTTVKASNFQRIGSTKTNSRFAYGLVVEGATLRESPGKELGRRTHVSSIDSCQPTGNSNNATVILAVSVDARVTSNTTDAISEVAADKLEHTMVLWICPLQNADNHVWWKVACSG